MRGVSRLTSRNNSTLGLHSTSDNVPKTADSFHRIENTKVTAVPAEVHGWNKRSAKTRERLQPIGADSTVTADEKHKSKGNESEFVKPSVPLLSDKTGITSGAIKDAKKQDHEGDRQDEISEGQFLPPIK